MFCPSTTSVCVRPQYNTGYKITHRHFHVEIFCWPMPHISLWLPLTSETGYVTPSDTTRYVSHALKLRWLEKIARRAETASTGWICVNGWNHKNCKIMEGLKTEWVKQTSGILLRRADRMFMANIPFKRLSCTKPVWFQMEAHLLVLTTGNLVVKDTLMWFLH